jgi:hypothetical protein
MRDEDQIVARLAQAEEGQRAARLAATISEYQADEGSALRASKGAFAMTLLAVFGIVGVAVAAIMLHSDDQGTSRTPFIAIGVVLAALAVFSAVRMRRLELLATELGRVRRQMTLLDAHVTGLPFDVAVLLKSVATQKILTEIGGAEPWVEPDWPDAGLLSKLIRQQKA